MPDERPENQTVLLGHDAALKTFADMYGQNTLAGSWMICGEKGIGKATLAFRLARFLFARESAAASLFGGASEISDTLEVSETDTAFKAVAARTHADLMVLECSLTDKELKDRQALLDAGKTLDAETESRRKRNNEIRADDIRRTNDFLRRTSGTGAWRVLIVDSADDMNANAANALLKSLEEPAANRLILLIAHRPSSLLPTIRSRCRKIYLKPLQNADMETLLQKHVPETDASTRAALISLAAGSIGDALLLHRIQGVTTYDSLLKLFSRFPDFDVSGLYAFADAFLKDKETVDAVAKLLERLMTKATKLAAANLFEPSFFENERAVCSVLAKYLSVPFLSDETVRMRRVFADTDLDVRQVFVNVCTRLQKGAQT